MEKFLEVTVGDKKRLLNLSAIAGIAPNLDNPGTMIFLKNDKVTAVTDSYSTLKGALIIVNAPPPTQEG